MIGQWATTAAGRRTLYDLLGAFCALCVFCWMLAVAYGGWLRFSSPRFAEPATGHTVYIKAVKGVFYVTPTEGWWAQGVLFVIGLTCLAAFLLRVRVGKGAASRGPTAAKALRIAGGVFVVATLTVLLLGDYVMALLFTGSLALPTAP